MPRTALFSLLCAGISYGQNGAGSAIPQSSNQDDRDWRVNLVPYLWITGLTGDVRLKGRDIPVDLGFADILDATDSLLAFEAYFDARKGKWGFFSDLMFIKLGVEGIVLEDGPINLTNRLNVVEFGGLYRLGSNGASDGGSGADVVFGVRSTFLELESKLSEIEGVTAGRDLTKSNQNWAEPFVGLRGQTDPSNKLSLVAEGNIGGFGAGSDFSWKTLVAVGFRVSRSFRILGGYRALGQDFSNDDDAFKWDMIIHGPIVGFNFTF